MGRILISDIMTRNPIIINPKTDLLKCAKKMVSKNIGSLLITENKKLIGFITQRDILWALIKKSKEDLSKINAIDISPKKIATTKPSASINDTIKKMKKLKFERLPVIYEKKLVGVITAKDILNFNPEFYPELEEFAKIREEEEKLKRIKRVNIKEFRIEGICEECGNQDSLSKFNGMLVCDSCKNSM